MSNGVSIKYTCLNIPNLYTHINNVQNIEIVYFLLT